MTFEKQPFEDVSPTKHGDVPLSCEFPGVYASTSHPELNRELEIYHP